VSCKRRTYHAKRARGLDETMAPIVAGLVLYSKAAPVVGVRNRCSARSMAAFSLEENDGLSEVTLSRLGRRLTIRH
jgi:hypothetical protein